MSLVSLLSSRQSRQRILFRWMLLLLALGSYLFGLGGQYVPTNGDELVYTHIARLTAASGNWLPLVSELDHMRNTKPPLLFWQAMVAGCWGDNWQMAALRAPSVLYTLALALAIGLTVQRITRDISSALLAACIYLAFFCTFRFGRTYLTSAPETFWLNLPIFALLWGHLRQPSKPQPDWLAHVWFGLAMGLGLAYKSFALIVPAAATLWLAQLLTLPTLGWRAVWQTSVKVALSGSLALAVFALWFVLDPDPASVWQEFVVGENAGKMHNPAGYWHTALLGGGFSIWAQSLGYVQNAGLLAFVVLGFMSFGLRQLYRRWHTQTGVAALAGHLRILLVWLGVWLLVFTLPSQRSARYLIPAMPALAMLLVLYWPRIARGWFAASLVLSGLFMLVLGRIAWSEYTLGMGRTGDLMATQTAVAIGMAIVFTGMFKACWTRTCALTAVVLTFWVFNLATVPLNGAAGMYPANTQAAVQQMQIAVPSSFNGQFERFQFLLPGNRFAAYDGEARAELPASENAPVLQDLLASHDAVVWLQTRVETSEPLCAPGCRILGTRWEVKGRHKSGDITLSNVWYPHEWLFRREWLLVRAKP